eukprot:9501558-Pyramimonas_sp.AAC.1
MPLKSLTVNCSQKANPKTPGASRSKVMCSSALCIGEMSERCQPVWPPVCMGSTREGRKEREARCDMRTPCEPPPSGRHCCPTSCLVQKSTIVQIPFAQVALHRKHHPQAGEVQG